MFICCLEVKDNQPSFTICQVMVICGITFLKMYLGK